MLATLSAVVEKSEAAKLADIITREGLTYNALEDWKDHFKADPKLTALSKELTSIHDDVFKRQKISHFDFEKELEDAGLTKELYIQIYRKIWASLRHDLWVEI
jgi:hypothetical protein